MKYSGLQIYASPTVFAGHFPCKFLFVPVRSVGPFRRAFRLLRRYQDRFDARTTLQRNHICSLGKSAGESWSTSRRNYVAFLVSNFNGKGRKLVPVLSRGRFTRGSTGSCRTRPALRRTPIDLFDPVRAPHYGTPFCGGAAGVPASRRCLRRLSTRLTPVTPPHI